MKTKPTQEIVRIVAESGAGRKIGKGGWCERVYARVFGYDSAGHRRKLPGTDGRDLGFYCGTSIHHYKGWSRAELARHREQMNQAIALAEKLTIELVHAGRAA